MQAQTDLHLTTAAANRAFATTLATSPNSGVTELRWAAVIAFYAAVHYVNGYLYERLVLEPSTHDERNTFVVTISDLRSVAANYGTLQDIGYRARYLAGFRITRQQVAALLDDLEAIRVAVLAALPDDVAES